MLARFTQSASEDDMDLPIYTVKCIYICIPQLLQHLAAILSTSYTLSLMKIMVMALRKLTSYNLQSLVNALSCDLELCAENDRANFQMHKTPLKSI